MKTRRHNFFRLLLCLIVAMGIVGSLATYFPAHADDMRSNSYWIQFGNFNVTSGQKSSASYNLTDTVGQVADGPYGQYGSSSYFVGSGFQYIYQIGTFSFAINPIDIDLGTLNAGTFNTGSNTLTISTKGASGYMVYAYELHALENANGVDFIPDTTCDAGTCTDTTAEVWTNPFVPGFGFNMSGDDIPADFVNSTYFRPFADQSLGEPMQVVMSSPNVADQRQSTVTYQVAIPGSQAAGNYQTAVVYVAVPGY